MEIQHQTVLTPKFNAETGLVNVIIQDRGTLRVLMLAQTNEAGYIETLETGEAVLWSRSKQRPWRPKASDEKAVPVHLG